MNLTFQIIVKKTTISPNKTNEVEFTPIISEKDTLVLEEYKQLELLDYVYSRTYEKVLLYGGVFSKKCKECENIIFETRVGDYQFLVHKFLLKYKGGSEVVFEPILIKKK